MAERDYASTPVSDVLGLRAIIDGLASDLQETRAGKISPADALARAALAKQIFNGVRLYMHAVRTVEGLRPAPTTGRMIEADTNA